jgi:hypothetical protein
MADSKAKWNIGDTLKDATGTNHELIHRTYRDGMIRYQWRCIKCNQTSKSTPSHRKKCRCLGCFPTRGPDPTPEEIKERAAAIRAKWGTSEYRSGKFWMGRL